MNKFNVQNIKKKKKIAFVNYNAYPCVVGGAEIFNFYLINNLSNLFDVHVITYCEVNRYDQNVSVHKIHKGKFLKRFLSPFQSFFFLLMNRDIRFIHVTYSRASRFHWFSFYLMKKLLKVNYMVTIHSGELAKWKSNGVFAYKLFFKNATRVTGVSKRIINEYEKRTGRKDIVFTPPLIPFKIISPKNKFREKWNIGSTDIVMLYVGSLKPLKSVHTLIEALGKITASKLVNYKLKLIIAGDGVSRSELEEMVVQLKLQKIVRFLGMVDTSEISELYNLANIYTICSKYEGLPISTLEALANKLPCISSDAPGLISISMQNKNTLLFRTGDYEDYAKKIEVLLNDSDLQNKLGMNGNKYYTELFSYDNLINSFKKEIEAC